MPSQPVIKYLTAAGLGSRRKIAEVIKAGAVSVNGIVVQSFNQLVDADKDTILYGGKPVQQQAGKKTYLMINKPKGVVSTTSDKNAEKSIIDILPAKYRNERLYPVGRLDKDSTGLILMTNDGDLTYKITHPRFEHEKEYLVQLASKLTSQDIQKFKRGVELFDVQTAPAVIKQVKIEPYNYSVIIHEGRKRQIRRMFGVLGYVVQELKRIRIGGLLLGDLAEGQCRELTPAEVRSLSLK